MDTADDCTILYAKHAGAASRSEDWPELDFGAGAPLHASRLMIASHNFNIFADYHER